MINEDNDDILGSEDEAPAKKKATRKKKPEAQKPSKVKVTKPAKEEAKPAKKGAAKSAPAKGKKAEAAPAKKSKKGADEETRGRPKTRTDDVTTTQPDDGVVLKAVSKLKEKTLAAEFAYGLGVHRRVIRAQLQRLAKDKSNGVKMEKDGYNWYVSKRA